MSPVWTWLLTACAATTPSEVVLSGATWPDGTRADLEIRAGRITAVGQVDRTLPRIDLSGTWLAPAAVDSHVHLAYWPVAAELAAGGVALAVDLAAPLSSLKRPPEGGPTVRWAGPMVTAAGGYPTQSWGEGGYGLEVLTEADARAAVDRLHEAGAKLVKVPIGLEPELSDAALAATVEQAHAHGLPVVAHALSDDAAARAAAAGVDALAHTPTEALSEATVQAWSDRVVISTLTAFGTGAETVDNLRRLRQAGATVLYGTDLGNTRTARIDGAELAALGAAGLDGRAVMQALTTAPAAFWGWDGGVLAVGAPASLVVLPGDPVADPSVWARPARVFLDGQEL